MQRPDVMELMRLARENPVVLEAVRYIQELEEARDHFEQAAQLYHRALSKIDYLLGAPNEMSLSDYDLHGDPELVTRRVRSKIQFLEELSATKHRLLKEIKELDKVVQAAKEYVHAPHYAREGAYDELVEALAHSEVEPRFEQDVARVDRLRRALEEAEGA